MSKLDYQTTLKLETAKNIAYAYGMNWGKDPQWHQPWFDNFVGLLYASFIN